MLKFTIFDIILLTIISFSTFLGGYKGAIKITLGFIVLIASIFAVNLISPYIETHLEKYIENIVILNIITIIIAFLISMIIFSILSFKLTPLVKIPGLVDNFLGLFLGLIRGVFISLILFMVIIIFFSSSYINAKDAHDIIKKVDKDNYPEWLKESVFFNYLDNAYHNLISVIPESTLKSIKIPDKNDESLEMIEKKALKNKPTTDDNMINDEFEIQMDK